MFLINYIPMWLVFIVFMVGIMGFMIKEFDRYRPIAVGLVFLSLFMVGYKTCNNTWEDRVKSLEEQIAQLESKKAEINTKVVTKIVTKEKIVKEAAEAQIQYVDREVVKYNDQCKIPPEVITIHNRAVNQ
jgi:cell division protein FtsL